ncbi:phenylalanine--tRNA ligase subunit alpha [Candidatus Saccharibacteria bacterium]|jgi:phenylalanyl-tRNA synthetase alpha chain|nr:phenylalanine--tRNA ligase subunit alpha [Candidatus Saccharibacteria bacterium]
MAYQFDEVAQAADILKQQFNEVADKNTVLKHPVFGVLFSKIKQMPNDQKSAFGAEVNALKKEVELWVDNLAVDDESRLPIDVTAPFGVNVALQQRPQLLPSEDGTIHPLMRELDIIIDIFYRMGFEVVESRQIDDDFHMFESLNFPKDHPARDDYDTFMTTEGLIAPAHTSTMQNRVLKDRKRKLDDGEDIRVVIPGRIFRNEDLDARHEHTFFQIEGVYVGKNINVGNLIATLKTFIQEYFQKQVEVKIQPFYFPFTEPSFEFTLSCPFCDKKGCNICGHSGWIELLGCGMINPNVLKMAGIDPVKNTGFAWGCGIDRLVMMKYDIEDIRHFHSGKLNFLRQFK